MATVLILASILTPTVLAVIELVKRIVSVPKNFLPLLAFIAGLAVGAVSYPFTDLELALRLWAGGISGLAATGLFEVGNSREGMTKQHKDSKET